MLTFKALGRNGNLGNSLFQYATTISVAKDKKYQVKLPYNPSYFDVNYNSMCHSMYDGFEMKYPVLSQDDIKTITAEYNDPSFHFTSDVFNVSDNTNLMGYFQSDRYFVHNREYILDNLVFKPEIKQRALEELSKININPLESAFIHVRRGDYVVKQDYHPLQTPAYYAEGAQILKAKNYVIFSDDIEWCKSAFGNNDKIKYSTNTNPFVDMCMMTLIKDAIICNSTFGWWGAWLSTIPDKKVIAPKKWFGPAYANWNTNDVIPAGWLRI